MNCNFDLEPSPKFLTRLAHFEDFRAPLGVTMGAWPKKKHSSLAPNVEAPVPNGWASVLIVSLGTPWLKPWPRAQRTPKIDTKV